MKFNKLSFVLVAHIYTTGPPLRFAEYLQNEVGNFILIGHPFSYAKDRRSFLRIYTQGKLIYERKFVNWNGPELSFYFKDTFLTIWWVLKYVPTVDYFVGVDSLNFFAGYILKKLHKVKRTIFYTMDYVSNRFSNRILNFVYHYLDTFAVIKSDKAWNLSALMVGEREKKGVSSKYRAKQIVVPVGAKIVKKLLPLEKIDRYKIVFLGHLREGQGVELLINAMQDVVKKVKQAHLVIIGGGPLEEELKKIVEAKKLNKNIEFTGFIKEYSEVEEIMRDAAVAVAPYVDDDKTYTRYTDPTKPKDYMACGIPVVITKVPQVAYEIEKNKCGFAINYNKQELVDAVIKLLTNDKLLSEFRENSIIMAKKYTWNKIFDKAINDTI